MTLNIVRALWSATSVFPSITPITGPTSRTSGLEDARDHRGRPN